MPSYSEYGKLLSSTVIRGNATSEDSDAAKLPILKYIEALRPKKLFRFRTCTEYNFDALLNDKIYFNAPVNFNDPHDCFSYVDMKKVNSVLAEAEPAFMLRQLHEMRSSTHLITENFSPNILPAIQILYDAVKAVGESEYSSLVDQLNSRLADLDRVNEEISQIIQYNRFENLKFARENTFISCLSKSLNSTLMWAHYSDYHKGFALEYDTAELIALTGKCSSCKEKCAAQHGLGLYPVVYSKTRYDATEYELETLKVRLSNYYYGMNTPFCVPDQLFYIKENTFKGLDWAYEKEWRLIYTCKPDHPVEKFEVMKPKAIYLGSQMSSSNKRIIRKLIEGKGLPVYEMFVDGNKAKYALSYKA